MAIELTMPALSPSMEKGTLAKWLIAEGDLVKPGDLIAEIETDKASMEYEVEEEGRVIRLLVSEGTEDVAVGTVIAVLGDAASSREPAAEPTALVTEAASPVQVETAAATPALAPLPAAAPVVAKSPVEAGIAIDEVSNASPLARRIAAAKGIDLEGLKGSGTGGRILKSDLGLQPVAALTPPPAPAASVQAIAQVAPSAAPVGVPASSTKLSGMRKTIARRLTESKQTVPHFYLTVRCNLDPLLALRSDLNVQLETRGVKLSVNDMLLKAMAVALVEVPEANVQFGGEELHQFERVDIAMAVAIEGGLITPVIKDAGALSLSAIAQQSKALAAKAREGRLMPEEYQGGTASLSNLGMFGIDEMVPVINPPQALILGIGAGVEQPWKVNGAVGLATVMAATASFDHRAIDGAVAARFMAAFKALIDQPMLLLG
ncbi:dihydrolipoamide acetyltransferase family protein [Novosphingobium aquimarinum]|uniref:dihydrolipoamide acetyltransferase family protein n=1 Tax=Novosphingobium aquimarinum TaxID=2682494 RepID=UPI0012EBB9E8|nr:dihydrolipoamide acetyltransferase family protein [Novosphingobium aquimarinum]